MTDSTPTTYTTTRLADPDAAYPETLMVAPTGLPIPEGLGSWYILHNRAISAHRRANVGAANDQTRNERGILALIDGAEQYIGSNPDAATEPHGAEHIVAPLLRAIGAALDYDLGRLDAGTLSAWVHHTATRCGLNPDNL